MKRYIRRHYLYWTDKAFFNIEEAIIMEIYKIRRRGYEPVNIYLDNKSSNQILEEFYGIPVKKSKHVYITYK